MRVLFLLLSAGLLIAHDDSNPALDRVSLIHGATGPFAVAGYRMGEAALRQLNLRRGSFDLEVIHYSPRKVEWSCIADGLQAATGASLGKLNLSMVESREVYSIVRNRKTGQEIRVELTPSFIQAHKNLPVEKLAEAGSKLSAAPEAAIFKMESTGRQDTAPR